MIIHCKKCAHQIEIPEHIDTGYNAKIIERKCPNCKEKNTVMIKLKNGKIEVIA